VAVTDLNLRLRLTQLGNEQAEWNRLLDDLDTELVHAEAFFRAEPEQYRLYLVGYANRRIEAVRRLAQLSVRIDELEHLLQETAA